MAPPSAEGRKQYAAARFGELTGICEDVQKLVDTWPGSQDRRVSYKFVVLTRPRGLRSPQVEHINFAEARLAEYTDADLEALKGQQIACTVGYTSNRDPLRAPYLRGVALFPVPTPNSAQG
jgi:hypothetical protein